MYNLPLTDSWKYLKTTPQKKKEMDFSLWLQWYAFDVIGELTFARRFGFIDQGKDIDDTLKNIDDSFASGILLAELPEFDKLRKNSLMRRIFPFLGNYDAKMNLIAKVTYDLTFKD